MNSWKNFYISCLSFYRSFKIMYLHDNDICYMERKLNAFLNYCSDPKILIQNESGKIKTNCLHKNAVCSFDKCLRKSNVTS